MQHVALACCDRLAAGLYAFYYLRSYFCQQRLGYSDHDSFSGYFVFLVGVGRGSRGVCGEDVAPSYLRDRSQKAGVGQMMLSVRLVFSFS